MKKELGGIKKRFVDVFVVGGGMLRQKVLLFADIVCEGMCFFVGEFCKRRHAV